MKPFSEPSLKTRQQMAGEYGICIKTLNKLLKKKNIFLDKGLITPKDQEIIFEKLGVPKNS